MSEKTIELVVTEFRKAIKLVNPTEFKFGIFENFPIGCCEFTSLLLVKYLIEEKGFKDVLMIYSEKSAKIGDAHVWLKVSTLDVDITADQFKTTDKSVFSEFNSKWHKR